MNARQAAAEGMRKRMQRKPSRETVSSQSSFYNAAQSSPKLSSNSVLVLSFVFMGIVLMMHVVSKLRGDRKTAN